MSTICKDCWESFLCNLHSAECFFPENYTHYNLQLSLGYHKRKLVKDFLLNYPGQDTDTIYILPWGEEITQEEFDYVKKNKHRHYFIFRKYYYVEGGFSKVGSWYNILDQIPEETVTAEFLTKKTEEILNRRYKYLEKLPKN